MFWLSGVRRRGGVILVCCGCMEREKASVDKSTGVVGPQGRERERAEAETVGVEYRRGARRQDRLVVAVRFLLAGVGMERRGRLIRDDNSDNRGVSPGMN